MLAQNHQVNALFVEGPHKIAVHGVQAEQNGTFIGSLGLKLYDSKVQIDTDEEGEMTGWSIDCLLHHLFTEGVSERPTI